MPLYDYRCQSCQAGFELLVRSSSVPVCPHCASTSLERMLSLPAAPGTSQAVIVAARRAAAREGHFSNYSRAEKARIK